MILNIAGKEVEAKAGVRFLEELDKQYQVLLDGQPVPFGLKQLFVNFKLKNIPSLKWAIYSATRTDKRFKPTPDQIDEFIESYEDGFEVLFDEFEELIKESNMTKKEWGMLSENTPEQAYQETEQSE